MKLSQQVGPLYVVTISSDKWPLGQPQVEVSPSDTSLTPSEQRGSRATLSNLDLFGSETKRRLHDEEDYLQGGYEASVCDRASVHSLPSLLSLYSQVEDVSDSHNDLDTAAVF